MNDKYLKIFPSMFFDVNANETVNGILREASDIFSIVVEKLGEVENELIYMEDVSHDDSYIHLVISLFVRKLMEQVDAINILYSYGSVTEAEPILRSMFETVVSLKFILNEDSNDREETRIRSAAYFIWHHYQELAIADKEMQPGGMMYGKLSSEDLVKLDAKKKAINNMINRNQYFKKVDEKRNKLKNPDKSAWYEIAGVHNFREMMNAVNMEKYYDGLYGPLSLEIHGLNIAIAMKIENNEILPNRIRSPHNGEDTFCLTCSFATIALRVLYEYLGDGEEEMRDFAKFNDGLMVVINKVESDLKKLII